MNSRRIVAVTRWTLSLLALAGIVLVYHRWVRVNATTVALTLVLFVLALAAKWGLRYAVAVSVAATAAYNYYFLPPVGTFTIADPQNWLALLTFLATGIIGARLSQRARDEAQEARARQAEVELLFALSRELLQMENLSVLVNTVPEMIARVAAAESVVVYLLQGDRCYPAGSVLPELVEVPHLRQLSLTLRHPEVLPDGQASIPLRSGVTARGLLVLRGVSLSRGGFEAIGSLVSIALDRAVALESVAKGEAAKESERLRTLFLDSITHELRTPLTSIKGAATALLADPEATAESRVELLTIVDEESDRLNRLVAEAVEMAQLEAQEVHMDFAPVALAAVVAEARGVCPGNEAGHRLEVRLPELPPVYADGPLIVKVLCNLLDNAAKYSAEGQPITVSAEQKGEEILCSVADRGIGIDSAEQSLIFERLYRAPSHAGTTSGTGMGLAISRAIVEAHGGALTVTSQPGYGSVFTFSLPVGEGR